MGTPSLDRQWCRDCFQFIPKAGWKPSAWENVTKSCRTCTNNYKRTTRNPEYREELKALKVAIKRAYKVEQAALRADIVAVRKQWKREKAQQGLARREFSRAARELGLDPDTMWELYQQHDRKCEICGVHEDALPYRMCMDHCHVTGAFRGWLCKSCNVGIGHLKDSADLVAKALSYLQGR